MKATERLPLVLDVVRSVRDILEQRVDVAAVPAWCARRGWESFLLGLDETTLGRCEAHGLGSELARLSYPVLDRAPQTQVARRPLLDGVQAMRLRYLDPANRWLESWPPVDRTADPQALPRAVELVLRLDDYGEIRRVVELVDFPPALVASAP